jgi:hypothetical protein
MKRSPKSQKRNTLIVLGIIVVVGAFFFATSQLDVKSANSNTVNPSPQQAQQQAQSSAAQNQTTTKTSSTGGSLQGASQTQSSGATGVAPQAPTGDFVSAHTVPLSAAMASACNTSPGASCQITFTKTDGTVKSLPAQTVDSSGSTTWNWTASTYLSSGTWKVTAVATASGKSSTASDSQNLVVQ